MFCAYMRLAGLSASHCRKLGKALCYNARKKDIASCTDLMSYVQ
jgi:hypothetical protein